MLLILCLEFEINCVIINNILHIILNNNIDYEFGARILNLLINKKS